MTVAATPSLPDEVGGEREQHEQGQRSDEGHAEQHQQQDHEQDRDQQVAPELAPPHSGSLR
jgi:hypothetical protein